MNKRFSGIAALVHAALVFGGLLIGGLLTDGLLTGCQTTTYYGADTARLPVVASGRVVHGGLFTNTGPGDVVIKDGFSFSLFLWDNWSGTVHVGNSKIPLKLTYSKSAREVLNIEVKDAPKGLSFERFHVLANRFVRDSEMPFPLAVFSVNGSTFTVQITGTIAGNTFSVADLLKREDQRLRFIDSAGAVAAEFNSKTYSLYPTDFAAPQDLYPALAVYALVMELVSQSE